MQQTPIESRNPRAVKFPPTESLGQKPAFTDGVKDAGAAKDGDGRRSIVGRARSGVKGSRSVEEGDGWGGVKSCEKERKEQACKD